MKVRDYVGSPADILYGNTLRKPDDVFFNETEAAEEDNYVS